MNQQDFICSKREPFKGRPRPHQFRTIKTVKETHETKQGRVTDFHTWEKCEACGAERDYNFLPI